MSTFDGQLEEIGGISVDRFDKANLNSSVYFLSHCHTDHMNGLGVDFFKGLINSDKYFYCSRISKSFLLGIFPGTPEERIIELELAVPKTIKYNVNENGIISETCLTVTTCTAGHCPGSVMFVFDKEEISVLYTGDFRVNPKDLSKLNPLNVKINGQNYAKKFTSIYLDTTFLTYDFPVFPSRKESCEEICRAVNSWLKTDENNMVLLECSASYGAEYLFVEISKRSKNKIHVSDKVYANYTRIPDLIEYATGDGSSARIHACGSKMKKDELWCRPHVESKNILTIVPSVLRWRGKDLRRFSEFDPRNRRRLYVCYSAHASFEELKDFVDYFKPDKIHPCVCPPESLSEIYGLLRKLMSYKRKSMESGEDCYEFKLAVPKTAKLSHLDFKSKYFTEDDDEDC